MPDEIDPIDQSLHARRYNPNIADGERSSADCCDRCETFFRPDHCQAIHLDGYPLCDRCFIQAVEIKVAKAKLKKLKEEQEEECHVCHGKGTHIVFLNGILYDYEHSAEVACSHCRGTGKKPNYIYSICPACHGTGIPISPADKKPCIYCDGTGKIKKKG